MLKRLCHNFIMSVINIFLIMFQIRKFRNHYLNMLNLLYKEQNK